MPASSTPRFTPASLRFLRALKRNNRREWSPHTATTTRPHVRQPMTAVVERLADDFRTFAPELVASPRLSLYAFTAIRASREQRRRIRRTSPRSSRRAGLPKHEGAGISSTCRRPSVDRRRHVRRDAAASGGSRAASRPTSSASARSFESPAFRKQIAIEGDKLQRVPRGFPATTRPPII